MFASELLLSTGTIDGNCTWLKFAVIDPVAGLFTPAVAVAVIDPSMDARPVAVTGLVIPAVAVPLAESVTTERVGAEATLEDPSAPIRTFTALAADVY
jgi:hypothetical protein